MRYCAVIRTLGKAGEKYQKLLDSLALQTLKPSKILVYIAEGYSLPKETIGKEQYIYVKKGMVAQRALPFDEVDTDYILFLDDDVYLPPTAVEHLFRQMGENNGDVIAADVFPNADRPLRSRIMMALSARMFARHHDKMWGYKVMRNGAYSYNLHPTAVMRSQTNAGPCFLCKKESYLSIRFEEELWMDKLPYALGDDQVMFYKMHLLGQTVLTSYDSGIIHLDAGSTLESYEKERTRLYCDAYFKRVFFSRFILAHANSGLSRFIDCLCFGYSVAVNLSLSLLRGDIRTYKVKKKGYSEARALLKTI